MHVFDVLFSWCISLQLFFFPQQDMDKLVYKMSPLHDNMRLLHEAAKRLPENSREQNLALELIEFLELLITLKISAEPDIQEHWTTACSWAHRALPQGPHWWSPWKLALSLRFRNTEQQRVVWHAELCPRTSLNCFQLLISMKISLLKLRDTEHQKRCVVWSTELCPRTSWNCFQLLISLKIGLLKLRDTEHRTKACNLEHCAFLHPSRHCGDLVASHCFVWLFLLVPVGGASSEMSTKHFQHVIPPHNL